MTEPIHSDAINEIARDYIRRGWNPVAIPAGEKGPRDKGWPDTTVTLENVDQHFRNGGNIGIQLGAKSGGLVDVDLDCAEAVALAPMLLPQTGAIFGRSGKPRSHYLYKAANVSDKKAAVQWKHDGWAANGTKPQTMVVELRIGGGNRGAQTMAPGSTHPDTGEKVRWDQDGQPAEIEYALLKKAVNELAVAVLFVRAWGHDERHEAALRLGGFLARQGWDPDSIGHFVEAIARAAGDDLAEKRRADAMDAAKAREEGDNAYGLPAISERFGESTANLAAKWLGIAKQRHDTSGILEDMNGQYQVVSMQGKVRVLTFDEQPRRHGPGTRRVPIFYSFEEFRNLHSHRKMPWQTPTGNPTTVGLGQWWLEQEGRRQYKGLVFQPGGPSEVEGYLNLWRGWGIEPKAGDWSRLRQHVREVLACGDEAMDRYIIRWAAWCVQNPGLPAEVALVIKGKKGTGKGLFGRALSSIFGQHGLQISSIGQLAGRFNAHLMDCAFLFADEAYWPGDKAAEGTLKRIITEPTIFIERKGVDGFEVDSALKIFMAANADWVVPATHDERRYAMSEAADRYMRDAEHFRALYTEMQNGGLGAMLFDLRTMDLEGWHPRQDIPKSAALKDQVFQSLDYEDQWFVELLVRGNLEGAEIERPDHAYSHKLYEDARRTVPRLKNHSDGALGRYLRKQGCTSVKLGEKRLQGWRFPPLADLRAIWRGILGDSALPAGDAEWEWRERPM